MSVISTKPKLSNLPYENIVNQYLDEDTVTPESNLPDDKWLNGYRSDIEVELGLTRAAQEANEREQAITDGESLFIRSGACRPIPITERAIQLKLAGEIHGRRRSKKKLEGLYDVLSPASVIVKVSPTTSTIKEPGKPKVTVRNSDIANFVTILERQTPLRTYADRRGPRTCEKFVEEQIQIQLRQFTRNTKGDKKMKHRKRGPGSGVSSSKSKISGAMRGRIPKITDFLAILTQNNNDQTDLAHELPITSQSAPQSALQQLESSSSKTQGKRTSDRNRQSPTYYGFDNSSSDSTIAAPPKCPRRAGDVEYYQAPPAAVVETVQNIAIQQLEERNISLIIGEFSSPVPPALSILEQDIRKLVRPMTVFEAENQEMSDLNFATKTAITVNL